MRSVHYAGMLIAGLLALPAGAQGQLPRPGKDTYLRRSAPVAHGADTERKNRLTRRVRVPSIVAHGRHQPR